MKWSQNIWLILDVLLFVVQYQTIMIRKNKDVKSLENFLSNLNKFFFLVPQINIDILFKELTIRGFMVNSYEKESDAALSEMVPLVKKVKE
jgi:hypothetical protein